MKDMLIQYLRKGKDNKPFGCLVGTKDGIGYSLCNEKDHFVKEIAKKIALGRTKKPYKQVVVYDTLKKAILNKYFNIMRKRKKDYYKIEDK